MWGSHARGCDSASVGGNPGSGHPRVSREALMLREVGQSHKDEYCKILFPRDSKFIELEKQTGVPGAGEGVRSQCWGTELPFGKMEKCWRRR